MEERTRDSTPLNNLEIWKFSKDFAVRQIIQINPIKDYTFRDQLTRSLLSIPSNIAEGYGRFSEKEFIRFLRIAIGSTYEAETQLLIAYEIKLLSIDLEQTQNDLKRIRIMLFRLIKSIEKRTSPKL